MVSQDSDFAELATLLGPPPRVVWLRTGNQPTNTIADTLRAAAELLNSFEGESVACLELY